EPLSAPTGRHLGNNLGVSHAAFSRDGRYLLINFVDRANVYDWRLKHDVVQILHPFWIDQADSSPDGNRVVTVSRMSAVAVITDVPSNKQWRTLAHNQQVTSACFSPDGKYILTTSEDRTARLWDAATAELVGEPWQHASAVLRAHFSRDSRQAVTLCNDGSARVWSVPTGKPLTPALRGSGAIVTARISPDGQLLATGLQDGTAWLWDIDSGLPVAPFCRLSGPVTCVEFSGDGQRLLTAGPDAVPRLHTLPAADPRPLDELTSWTPLLSGHRIDGDAGMLAPLPARDLLLAWQNTAGRKQKAEAQGPEGAAQLLAWHQQVCADATARREWRVALFHLDAVIRAEPKKAALHSQRGQINPLRGHSTQAIADFTQALALDPNDGLALDGRAQAYAALGRWDQSLPDWAQAVERLPADPQRLLYLSLACAVTGDRAGADAAYQRAEVLAMATQLSPQATWNQRHLHARPVEPDSWHELIEDCELLAVDLTDQPTGPAIYRACGLAHAVLQDWSEALESYHTVLALDPQDWRARCARACIHAERKDYAAAIADLNQVLKGSPQHGSAWYLRGSLLRALRQQAAVAAHDFTRAIAAGLDSGVVRLQRGLAYAEMEQWPQAAADLEAARRQGLGSDALVPLTLVLLAQGQLPAARDASADLVKTLTSTEDPQLAVKIAWVCSLQAGAEMGPCRALLERLTSSLKDVSWLWTVQAAVLYRSGKYAEAEAALAKTLALHKQGGGVFDWYLLALTRERSGQHDKALAALERAVAIHEALQRQPQALNWETRLAARLWRQQAEALVNGT
ncbi:MAG TPA: tetratricopeptide repeat protein, partial [Roseiflexaceae bacterium]